MRILGLCLLALGLSACGSTWTGLDSDGDGYTLAAGDCDDGPNGDSSFPGAEEIWYDGVDQNCDGADDFDQDGDGERVTSAEGGTDCWDDPGSIPPEYVALNGFAQPAASDVHLGADEVWYDGVDQDCGEEDDFDQDMDGFASTAWSETRTTLPVEDCFDAVTEVYPELWPECVAMELQVVAVPLSPSAIYPDAPDTWYDGTDANCDESDDFDADADGYAACAECDDDDPAIFPNDAEERWYNHVDENCDGNDADQDGDGYLTAGYVEADVNEPVHLPGAYGSDDCWDAPAVIPEDFDAINGMPQPAAEDVHPDAVEAWYDGVDQDCGEDDDFDQDEDGDASDSERDRTGGVGNDCNDEDGTVNSSAAETWYDGTDQNCDGESDYDQDRDGYDSSDYSYGTADDCDDTKASVHPSTPGDEVNEDCGTVYDDDCDGNTNDDDADSCVAYYDDADLDGYGDINDDRCLCTAEGTYTETGVTASNDDCDDTRSAVSPAAANESCSTTYDDDCDGVTNEQNGTSCTTYYYDGDNDSWGDSTSTQCWCATSGSYDVTRGTDCDDTDARTYPGVATSNSTTACMSDADSDTYGSTTAPSGGSAGTDCDDSKSGVRPGATETCGTAYDDDCDSDTNDIGATGCTTYYYDGDNDTYGKSTLSQCTCTTSGSYDVTTTTDCDDADADTFPGAAPNDSTTSCMNDDDADDYGDDTVSGSVVAGDDCDDTRSTVSPADTETCSTSYDDDCEGGSNDVGATGCTTYYYDGDSDGYGITTSYQCTCSSSGSYSTTSVTSANDDCDDTDAAVSPGDAESCATSYDDDCDGTANEASATGCTTYYYDGDNDGYGLSSSSTCTCTASGSYDVTTSTDCDDGDADTFPGAATLDSASSCMNDDDGDNYGDATVSGSVVAGSDCDDTRPTVSPADTETCSTTYDDDCDGSANDVGATGCTTYYYDGDNDGYGISTSSQCTCSASGSYDVTTTTDCDDSRSGVYPGATETCATSYDDDCDSSANDVGATACTTYYYDGDGDGYGLSTSSQCTCSASGSYDTTDSSDCNDGSSAISPAASDTFSSNDGVDNDCDGYIDEAGVTYGDLVITEFFGGNALQTYDWFEVYNNSGDTLSLSGWTASLCHEADSTVTAPYTDAGCDSEVVITFPTTATVADGAYYVVCGSTSGGIWTTPADCDLLLTDYDSPAYTTTNDLENPVGGVHIDLDGTTIDEVYWWQESGSDDWPAYAAVTTSYASVQLDLDTLNAASPDPADQNDDYSTDTSAPYAEDIWCLAGEAGVTTDWSYAFTMYGTPGAANVACP